MIPPTDANLNKLSLEYTYDDIRSACGFFGAKNQLGKGTYGSVYKGALKDGTGVAIKVLNLPKESGFKEEVEVLSKFRHPNLVILMGFARGPSKERLLVYELLVTDVCSRLNDQKKIGNLLFKERMSILFDSALGLSHLHNSKPQVFHRDIKSQNILLDKKGTAKMADFGLALLAQQEVTDSNPINNNIPIMSGQGNNIIPGIKVEHTSGTIGYADPQYINSSIVTEKSEVYSYGMVTLEILTSRPPALQMQDGRIEYQFSSLLESAKYSMSDAIRRLGEKYLDRKAQFPPGLWEELTQYAFQCVHDDNTKRPTFVDIVAKYRHWLQRYEHVDIGGGSQNNGPERGSLNNGLDRREEERAKERERKELEQRYKAQADIKVQNEVARERKRILQEHENERARQQQQLQKEMNRVAQQAMEQQQLAQQAIVQQQQAQQALEQQQQQLAAQQQREVDLRNQQIQHENALRAEYEAKLKIMQQEMERKLQREMETKLALAQQQVQQQYQSQMEQQLAMEQMLAEKEQRLAREQLQQQQMGGQQQSFSSTSTGAGAAKTSTSTVTGTSSAPWEKSHTSVNQGTTLGSVKEESQSVGKLTKQEQIQKDHETATKLQELYEKEQRMLQAQKAMEAKQPGIGKQAGMTPSGLPPGDMPSEFEVPRPVSLDNTVRRSEGPTGGAHAKTGAAKPKPFAIPYLQKKESSISSGGTAGGGHPGGSMSSSIPLNSIPGAIPLSNPSMGNPNPSIGSMGSEGSNRDGSNRDSDHSSRHPGSGGGNYPVSGGNKNYTGSGDANSAYQMLNQVNNNSQNKNTASSGNPKYSKHDDVGIYNGGASGGLYDNSNSSGLPPHLQQQNQKNASNPKYTALVGDTMSSMGDTMRSGGLRDGPPPNVNFGITQNVSQNITQNNPFADLLQQNMKDANMKDSQSSKNDYSNVNNCEQTKAKDTKGGAKDAYRDANMATTDPGEIQLDFKEDATTMENSRGSTGAKSGPSSSGKQNRSEASSPGKTPSQEQIESILSGKSNGIVGSSERLENERVENSGRKKSSEKLEEVCGSTNGATSSASQPPNADAASMEASMGAGRGPFLPAGIGGITPAIASGGGMNPGRNSMNATIIGSTVSSGASPKRLGVGSSTDLFPARKGQKKNKKPQEIATKAHGDSNMHWTAGFFGGGDDDSFPQTMSTNAELHNNGNDGFNRNDAGMRDGIHQNQSPAIETIEDSFGSGNSRGKDGRGGGKSNQSNAPPGKETLREVQPFEKSQLLQSDVTEDEQRFSPIDPTDAEDLQYQEELKRALNESLLDSKKNLKSSIQNQGGYQAQQGTLGNERSSSEAFAGILQDEQVSDLEKQKLIYEKYRNEIEQCAAFGMTREQGIWAFFQVNNTEEAVNLVFDHPDADFDRVPI